MKGEAFSFKTELKIKQQQQQESLGVCSDYYAPMIQRGKHTKNMKTSSSLPGTFLSGHIFSLITPTSQQQWLHSLSHIGCFGQLTRTVFVYKWWTKATGLIINTRATQRFSTKGRGDDHGGHAALCWHTLTTTVAGCRCCRDTQTHCMPVVPITGGWDPSSGSPDELERWWFD